MKPKAASTDTLIYGLHAVEGVLGTAPRSIEALWLDRGRRDKRMQGLEQLAQQAGIPVNWSDKKTLSELVPEGRHQGVVARIQASQVHNETYLEQLLQDLEVPPFLLILDGVQDPHNLGACLRSADAAGVHAVITPKDRACGLTATVRKVASGAAETTPLIQVTNLARTLKFLRHLDIWLVGAAGETEQELYQTDLTGPLAVVMGTEGKGLRRLTRENCDVLVKIPMVGAVESLNVSVATGICLFEALRQRNASG